MVFKDNLRIKFVIIVDKIKEMLDEMNKIRYMEDISFLVLELERNCLSNIIYSYVECLYVNYLIIVGIGISNVRFIDGIIIDMFCIVIYCLDRLIKLFGEKFLLISIGGCICDIRENIILFGICIDCGEENVKLGCSVGMIFSSVYGFVGFLVKLNFIRKDEIGFIIVVYVVIWKLEKLYFVEMFFLICNKGDESIVIVYLLFYYVNFYSI